MKMSDFFNLPLTDVEDSYPIDSDGNETMHSHQEDLAMIHAINNHDKLVEQLTNSQHCINAIGMVMTDTGYTPKEKVQKIKSLMGVHVNEKFTKNSELLAQLKGNE